MTLNARSRDRLKGVHPDLVGVVEQAAEIAPGSFIVTEGLRTPERQYQLKFTIAAKAGAECHIGNIYAPHKKLSLLKDSPHFELDRKQYP